MDGRCTSQSELQLLKSDREEHAHRSVGRLLRAGTDYKFIDGTYRAVCVESYKTLLGPFFPEYGLPSFGGRQFIAGEKTCTVGLSRRHTSTILLDSISVQHGSADYAKQWVLVAFALLRARCILQNASKGRATTAGRQLEASAP